MSEKDGPLDADVLRNRAEDELRKSEARYRDLFNAMVNGFALHEIILDGQGIPCDYRFLTVNAAFEQLTNLKAADIIGRKMMEIAPQTERFWIDTYGRVALTGEPCRFEHFSVVQGKHYEVNAYCPQKGQFASVFADITERKQAEEGKARNEIRMKKIVDILQHPFETIQGFLDYALEQAIQLTASKIGYIYHYHEDRKEFVLNTWSKGVMPECAVVNPQTCYELDKTGIWGEAVRQRRSIIVNDFQATHLLKKGYPQGHVPLLKFMTVPFFQGDNIVGVVGLANKEADYNENDVLQISLLMDVVWKVTDRRRAEDDLRGSQEYFSRIIDAVADPIFVKDRGHRWVLVNKAFCVFMGRAFEEVRNKSDYEFFPKAEADVFWAKDEEVFRSGLENVNQEYFTDGAGLQRTIITKKTLYKDEAGREYIVGVIRDVTDRNRTEDELRRHAKELEIFYKASIGREERILELKKEIERMKRDVRKQL